MRKINWQEAPPIPKIPRVDPIAGNLWFGMTMGLLGIILGYVLTTATR